MKATVSKEALNTIEYRKLRESDIPSVTKLVKQCFPKMEREPECWLDKNYNTCFVATPCQNRKKIIGFVLMDHCTRYNVVDLIATEKSYRRQGIATQLMFRLARSLKRAGNNIPWKAFPTTKAGKQHLETLLNAPVYMDDTVFFDWNWIHTGYDHILKK